MKTLRTILETLGLFLIGPLLCFALICAIYALLPKHL